MITFREEEEEEEEEFFNHYEEIPAHGWEKEERGGRRRGVGGGGDFRIGTTHSQREGGVTPLGPRQLRYHVASINPTHHYLCCRHQHARGKILVLRLLNLANPRTLWCKCAQTVVHG